MQQPPAKIGDALVDVDTPALLVDLDAFEENLKRLADFAKAKGLKLRPHAKTHKSPVVALKQIALGAVGQCCQKLGEAEVLAQGGVKDILISNQIVGATKLERLAALAREVKLGVCVDDLENAKAISAALGRYDAKIEMLVEITAGMERCGIAPGQPAADLANAVSQLPHVTFCGIQAYHGSAQHKRTPDERRAAIQVAADAVAATKKALAALGLPCPRVTGAGTGTFELETASGLWDELQCGSYAFMDADYARNLESGGRPFSSFKHSLFLWATVMSRPTPTRAVCDVGLKSTSAESGLPTVPELPDVTYVGASDEHGALKLGPAAPTLPLGTKIKLIPGHCDPTINLHDWYVGIRKGRVEALWPIAARGISA